jgi:hypothetical protein
LSTTEFNFGTNLFFDPVPLEFLRAPAAAPQVLVTVEGIDALCASLSCDYSYIAPVGEITEQTLSGFSVTIRGTELPITADITRVVIGDQDCTTGTISSSTTEVTCSLSDLPVAGTHSVQLLTEMGAVGIADGTTEIAVDLIISLVESANELNRYGGSTITITGTGFGSVAADVVITMTGDGTTCRVYFIEPTSITCVTRKSVDIDNCLADAPTVTMTVGGVTAVSAETLACDSVVH